MSTAKSRFDVSIVNVKNLHSLYLHFTNELGFDESIVADILRSEIVYAVGALDRFIHDIVLDGVIEIYSGRKNPTSAFNNISLNLNQHQVLSSSPIPEFELRKIISSVRF